MSSGNDEEIESINGEEVASGDSDSSSPYKESSPEEDLGKLKNEYLYLRAEFDNFRKNSIKERSQLIKYGTESLIRDLLDVVDNFERALEMDVNDSNIESYQQGVELTASELRGVLSKFGVSESDPTGKPFDPNLHEALSSEPTDKVHSGHVLNVFKKAYLLHDKLIRPAQVVVAREPDKKNSTENIDDNNS